MDIGKTVWWIPTAITIVAVTSVVCDDVNVSPTVAADTKPLLNPGLGQGYNERLGVYERISAPIEVVKDKATFKENAGKLVGGDGKAAVTINIVKTIVSKNGGYIWSIEANDVNATFHRAEVYKVADKYSYWVFKRSEDIFYMGVNLNDKNIKLWKVTSLDKFNYVECLANIIKDDKICPTMEDCLEKQYDVRLPRGDRNINIDEIKNTPTPPPTNPTDP